MSHTISANFFSDYKMGDNIKYNLSVLKALYQNEDVVLVKPKIVIQVSLIEACLYDFIYRIRTQTTEFQYLEASIREKIRGRSENKIYDLQVMIKLCKQKLIMQQNDAFWDTFDELRKLRNRTHIQNRHNNWPPDEQYGFTTENLNKAETAVDDFFEWMQDEYPRPGHIQTFDLKFPW